jgi:hypothetical protein
MMCVLLQVLGVHGEELPRNCLSKSCHAYCNLGCRTGHKQSSDMCWLVDAVRAGAHILTGVQGQRVLTAPAEVRGASLDRQPVGQPLLCRARTPMYLWQQHLWLSKHSCWLTHVEQH